MNWENNTSASAKKRDDLLPTPYGVGYRFVTRCCGFYLKNREQLLLINTKDKKKPEVLDLDNVIAREEISPKPNPIAELGFEMNRRASGMKGLIGYTMLAGGAGGVGGGLGLVGLSALGVGGGVTTLTTGGAGFHVSGVTFSGAYAIIGSRLATMTYTTLSGAGVLNMANWRIESNQGWAQQVITQRLPVYVSTPLVKQFLVNSVGKPTIFAQELQQLGAAGYYQWGQWLIPPVAR